MLLLPVFALALMAFVIILGMLCFAGACEQHEQHRRLHRREPIFWGLNLNSMTENARLIWATQLPALQRLETSVGRGVSTHTLQPWYAAMARRYPALYEGHKLDEWLEFLEDSRVICRQQGRWRLADSGQSVLEQCRRACEHDSGWLR